MMVGDSQPTSPMSAATRAALRVARVLGLARRVPGLLIIRLIPTTRRLLVIIIHGA